MIDLNGMEDTSFFERYRLVLKQILDGSVKEITFIQRFCSETKFLFQKLDKSCHERLWTESGLKTSKGSTSIHYISILRFLIPVIDTKILEEEIKPEILAFEFTKMDQELSEAISVLLEFVNLPSSYINSHFQALNHPVKIKFNALNILKNPCFFKGDEQSALVLRYILNRKPSPDVLKLRAIGDMIPNSSVSKDCKVLKILFQGKNTELPEDMTIDSFFDALKYFSRYLDDPRIELRQSLLKSFSKLLEVSDPRISLRVVDGLVRFGASIDYQFVHTTLEDVLKSYMNDDGIPPKRDPEESYIDRKILSCTLEACRQFFKPDLKDDVKVLFESLLMSSKLEINHRVLCLQILTKLTSKENSDAHMNSDLWFRHTTCRYWEIQETFLLYISKLVLLNRTKGLPPLKGFISIQLKHENSFVRAASINVLHSVVLREGTSGLLNIIDSADIEKFFRLIFESETEAIVRREAANLLSIVEMSDIIKKTSIFVLENDLDWEVKEIILNIWKDHLNDPLALQALEIAKVDHEKRLRQKAFKFLKKMGKQCDEENCFDEYVDVIYGLPGLMNDILQTKDESYKIYDADCF